MTDYSISDLLVEWEEQKEAGRELTPDELCKQCPEHRAEIRKRIQQLQAMEWMDSQVGSVELLNKHDFAFLELDEAIRQKPFASDPYLQRGQAYLREGEDALAIDDFTMAIILAPNNGNAYRLRGQAYHRKQRYSLAINDFAQALQKSNSIDANIIARRGCAYFAIQEYDQAIEDFTEVIRSDPLDANAYFMRGRSYAKNFEHDQAINDFYQAIQIYIANGQADRAVSAFVEAGKLDPKESTSRRKRGRAWLRNGAYDEAIEDFTEVIRLNAVDGHAYFMRGQSYAKKFEYDRAINDFYQAIQIYIANDQADRAVRVFVEASQLNPKDGTAESQRGQVCLTQTRAAKTTEKQPKDVAESRVENEEDVVEVLSLDVTVVKDEEPTTACFPVNEKKTAQLAFGDVDLSDLSLAGWGWGFLSVVATFSTVWLIGGVVQKSISPGEYRPLIGITIVIASIPSVFLGYCIWFLGKWLCETKFGIALTKMSPFSDSRSHF